MPSPSLLPFAQPSAPPSQRPKRGQALRQDFRQHCSPRADRLPRWMQRVWAWF